jgi:hypothetical protein
MAARWVFVTAILESFQMRCLFHIAHYTNEPRQGVSPGKSRCGSWKLCEFAHDHSIGQAALESTVRGTTKEAAQSRAHE